MVRTTLTLDDDVAAKLRAEARRTGSPFKQLVNNLLRLALKITRQCGQGPYLLLR
ncbi:MAG: hypothetical protein DMG69_25080 [Acidobacteria bacterium]|nr:MAG: hypothetical protein DMG69_25080 [Acidobacteriota bacterium]